MNNSFNMFRYAVPAEVPVIFTLAKSVRAAAESSRLAPYCSPTTDAYFIASVMACTDVCDKAAALANTSPTCPASSTFRLKAVMTPTSVVAACSISISPTVDRFRTWGMTSKAAVASKPACARIR